MNFPMRLSAARGARLPGRSVRGFTLIEILVVMALIGIVLALVANKVAEGAVKGKREATKIALSNLSGSIQTYSLDVGNPPARLEELLAKPGNASNWNGPYVKEKELKDPWNHPFVYHYPSTHGGDFDLYSLGPDGKEGGEGLRASDITNWE
jgi:general secretion pathway protein G